jgi:hypothetical protein
MIVEVEMRRTVLLIIFGAVLILAGWTTFEQADPPVVETSVVPFPVDYRCMRSSDVEDQLCQDLGAALLATGSISFEYTEGEPFFRIIVLPTERDGYFAIGIVTGFFYAPLEGLALSAYFANVLLAPDGATEENYAIMAKHTVQGMSRWILASGDDILKICKDEPRGLEASND